MAPKLDVDPNAGQRAQLSMRTSTLLAVALLAACGGVQPPATVPAPDGAVPLAPPGVPASSALPAAPVGAAAPAVVTGRPLIPETWSLAG